MLDSKERTDRMGGGGGLGAMIQRSEIQQPAIREHAHVGNSPLTNE